MLYCKNAREYTTVLGLKQMKFQSQSIQLVLSYHTVLLCMLLLGACGAAAPVDDFQSTGSGAPSPAGVVEFFFKDLDKALKDPALAQNSVRERWSAQLANYFAPDERSDQRDQLQKTLDSFASELKQVDADQTVTIDVRFDRVHELKNDGRHALVQIDKGSIYLLIQRGTTVNWEQTLELSKIMGHDDSAVPTVKVGPRWYLTEQY